VAAVAVAVQHRSVTRDAVRSRLGVVKGGAHRRPRGWRAMVNEHDGAVGRLISRTHRFPVGSKSAAGQLGPTPRRGSYPVETRRAPVMRSRQTNDPMANSLSFMTTLAASIVSYCQPPFVVGQRTSTTSRAPNVGSGRAMRRSSCRRSPVMGTLGQPRLVLRHEETTTTADPRGEG
jgi:hypothetical protein